MMGWDEEDAAACEEARQNASSTSDFKALWFTVPAMLGVLFLIGWRLFSA